LSDEDQTTTGITVAGVAELPAPSPLKAEQAVHLTIGLITIKVMFFDDPIQKLRYCFPSNLVLNEKITVRRGFFLFFLRLSIPKNNFQVI
jgi:hypothetical protein